MKESKKNMTESVTDEIETLEDNFRSLDKNMQAEQKEPDIYSAKLPIIIEELRSQDKQVVSEDECTSIQHLPVFRLQVLYICFCRAVKPTLIRGISFLRHLKQTLCIQQYS